MIALVAVVLAFPLGFWMRSWFVANVTYAVAYLWSFVFQTLYLLLDSLGGSTDPAFAAQQFPIGYGVVTLTIFGVGFGLVALGHHSAARRSRRGVTAAVD